MKKVVLLGCLFVYLAFMPLWGATTNEDDPILIRINGREVTVSEFEYVYTKNNLNPQVMDPKSMEEYLELFINFNLKVYEALQLKLDTHSTFINELEGYRSQLAQPYLTDQKVSNNLLDEALERMQYDVRASHILIALEKHAQDTIKAWQKAMEIREKVLEGGDFAQLARKYSDDPSAKPMPATPNRPASPGNSGDLGYFSVLDMVYPFENAVYNTPVNEVTMPVRTDFGYHIIKVTDRLPAMGRARVAHIMVAIPSDPDAEKQQSAREKIEEIHQKITEGENFEELAQRFSDDKASGRRGGELPPFTPNRMANVPEFVRTIATLDDQNPISEPVQTRFGWHILKLLDKQLPSPDEALADLKNRISRDSRAFLSQQVVIDRLKKEYNFVEHADRLDVFFSHVDENIFEGSWDMNEVADHDRVMFGFADQTFTQQDFARYLERVQSRRTPESIHNYINTMYKNFKNQQILAYEETQLPQKYPEFSMVLKEYHDGILLFELTDQKVWSKAMQDTTGLKKFFEDNIDLYTWDDRFDVILYTFNTERSARDGRKQIRRALRRGITHEELMEGFNKESQLEVSYEKGVMEIGQQPILSKLSREEGVSNVIQSDNHFIVALVKEFLPSQPKKLNEIRGLVIADYQNYLEKKWVQELREKYSFQVYRDALKTLKTDK